mmetsp:Transcript_47845/g.119606  ORF Transcript_47845/g.119606 Transcript_47845/m.119606 type:complete len:376 (-) Transcript_47845:59-1186(-)
MLRCWPSICCSPSCSCACASALSLISCSCTEVHRLLSSWWMAASARQRWSSARSSIRSFLSASHASSAAWWVAASLRSCSIVSFCAARLTCASATCRAYASCCTDQSSRSSACAASAARRMPSSCCAEARRSESVSISLACSTFSAWRVSLSRLCSSTCFLSCSISALSCSSCSSALSRSPSRSSFWESQAFISATCFCSASKSLLISSADEARMACSALFSRSSRSLSCISSATSSKSCSSLAFLSPSPSGSRSDRGRSVIVCVRLSSRCLSLVTTALAVWMERSWFISVLLLAEKSDRSVPSMSPANDTWLLVGVWVLFLGVCAKAAVSIREELGDSAPLLLDAISLPKSLRISRLRSSKLPGLSTRALPLAG